MGCGSSDTELCHCLSQNILLVSGDDVSRYSVLVSVDYVIQPRRFSYMLELLLNRHRVFWVEHTPCSFLNEHISSSTFKVILCM